MVLPTPTGPRMRTSAGSSRKRSVQSWFQSWPSNLTVVVWSQSSRRMAGSRRAVRARRSPLMRSRRATSSASSSSRKSWYGSFCWRASWSRSGRVSRMGESLRRRSTWRSSAEMTSAIAVLLPDGELGGVAGEAGTQDGGQAELTASFPSLVFEGALQHPLDADDVDHVELQGPAAGLLHALGSEALDQAEQPVDLAHPGPGQRVVQEPGGVDTDLLPVAGGLPLSGTRCRAWRTRACARADPRGWCSGRPAPSAGVRGATGRAGRS